MPDYRTAGPDLDEEVIRHVFKWPILEEWKEDQPYPHVTWNRTFRNLPGYWCLWRSPIRDGQSYSPSRNVKDAWDVWLWVLKTAGTAGIDGDMEDYGRDGSLTVWKGWAFSSDYVSVTGSFPVTVCQLALLVAGAITEADLNTPPPEAEPDAPPPETQPCQSCDGSGWYYCDCDRVEEGHPAWEPCEVCNPERVRVPEPPQAGPPDSAEVAAKKAARGGVRPHIVALARRIAEEDRGVLDLLEQHDKEQPD